MQVECKKCGKLIEMNNKMLLDHNVDGDKHELYFVCPVCKEKYHVCYTNSDTRNISKLLEKARRKKNITAIKTLHNLLEQKMDTLNNRA